MWRLADWLGHLNGWVQLVTTLLVAYTTMATRRTKRNVKEMQPRIRATERGVERLENATASVREVAAESTQAIVDAIHEGPVKDEHDA